jgi:hypothetical protein
MKDKARCEQGIHGRDHVRVLQRSGALHCSTGTVPSYILTILSIIYRSILACFLKKNRKLTYFDSSLGLPALGNIMTQRHLFVNAKGRLFSLLLS